MTHISKVLSDRNELLIGEPQVQPTPNDVGVMLRVPLLSVPRSMWAPGSYLVASTTSAAWSIYHAADSHRFTYEDYRDLNSAACYGNVLCLWNREYPRPDGVPFVVELHGANGDKIVSRTVLAPNL